MNGSKVGQVWVVSDPPDGTSVGSSLTGPQEQWCASLVDEAVASRCRSGPLAAGPRHRDCSTFCLENTQRFKPMFEAGNVSFIHDSLCWRGAEVMGDCPGSLKFGSFKLLNVGGRETGCPGRGCILSDAALCSNADCSQILLLPNSGRTDHDTEVGLPKHLMAHLFDLGAEGHTTIVRYTQERRRRGVQLHGTPLMVIWGRHCASALSRLKKATSHFAALRVRRACWLQLTTLSTSACILRATSSFIRPRQVRARSSA